jgi:cellulase/cellobiase CelA1
MRALAIQSVFLGALLAGGVTAHTTPASAAAACEVSYRVKNTWSGAFHGELVVTNTGTTTHTGWTLQFAFPGNQVISSMWNGSASQTGNQVTVTPVAWYSPLPPGTNASIGFVASFTGPNASPTAFTLQPGSLTCTVR